MNTATHHNHQPFAFRKPRMFLIDGKRLGYEFGGAFMLNAKGEKSRQEGYTTVMIPLKSSERRNSTKKCHFQVVRNSRLKELKDNAFTVLRNLRR